MQRNFEHRKLALGHCGRAYATSCVHEHSCIRCPMLRIDPAQRDRLEEIRDNLLARIAEAEREGWAGETEGLKVSLAAASNKLAQADLAAGRRTEAVSLGIPAYRDITAATPRPVETHIDTDHLATALRACAAGICAVEAGLALLISNGTFLRRDDFTSQFIEHGPAAAPRWPTIMTLLTGQLCTHHRTLRTSTSPPGLKHRAEPALLRVEPPGGRYRTARASRSRRRAFACRDTNLRRDASRYRCFRERAATVPGLPALAVPVRVSSGLQV